MHIVGVVEIVAGLLVFSRFTRYAALPAPRAVSASSVRQYGSRAYLS